jgi:hypothetical protein
MSFDSHMDRLRLKLFKKLPPTVMDIYDNLVLSSYLKDKYAPRRTIGQNLQYFKEKWQVWRLSAEQKHELVKEILLKVCDSIVGDRWWLIWCRTIRPTSIPGTCLLSRSSGERCGRVWVLRDVFAGIYVLKAR